jgi:hypothetical protein
MEKYVAEYYPVVKGNNQYLRDRRGFDSITDAKEYIFDHMCRVLRDVIPRIIFAR